MVYSGPWAAPLPFSPPSTASFRPAHARSRARRRGRARAGAPGQRGGGALQGGQGPDRAGGRLLPHVLGLPRRRRRGARLLRLGPHHRRQGAHDPVAGNRRARGGGRGRGAMGGARAGGGGRASSGERLYKDRGQTGGQDGSRRTWAGARRRRRRQRLRLQHVQSELLLLLLLLLRRRRRRRLQHVQSELLLLQLRRRRRRRRRRLQHVQSELRRRRRRRRRLSTCAMIGIASREEERCHGPNRPKDDFETRTRPQNGARSASAGIRAPSACVLH